MTLLRPRALKKGGTIGVVSPSYAPKLGWLQRGVRALERAGFNVILDPEIDRCRASSAPRTSVARKT